MEGVEPQAAEQDQYFEHYEVTNEDISTLSDDLDQLFSSGLVEEEVLKEIRFVTYDSRYLYVFTRGAHASNDRFQVEELPSTSTSGLRIFKIPHSGFIGKTKQDYRGARAWLLCDEVETTAIGAKKFPNENVLYEPDLPQPENILDTVQIPPIAPYNKIQKGRFNYKTDMVFHEAGHIDQRRLENWQLGDPMMGDFPSEEQRARFESVVRNTKVLPEGLKDLVIKNINRRALCEMYAMVIDSEAGKRYDSIRQEASKNKHLILMNELSSEPVLEGVLKQFEHELEWPHYTGQLLVRILEELFPDFKERKLFLNAVFGPKPQP